MLACFKRAKIVNGMEYINELIDLDKQIANSTVVFTGEGSFDHQTLEGKVVSKIYELCLKHNKPLFILCGINKLTESELESLLTQAETPV